jgi:hypothetical protein
MLIPCPLRRMGKSAEPIDNTWVESAPLGAKSAEVYENEEVR